MTYYASDKVTLQFSGMPTLICKRTNITTRHAFCSCDPWKHVGVISMITS